MENTENTNTKTLIDYKEIIKEFLNGEDINRISTELVLSERTVRNYISGQIPDSIGGKAVANAILEKVIIIIDEKKAKLESI